MISTRGRQGSVLRTQNSVFGTQNTGSSESENESASESQKHVELGARLQGTGPEGHGDAVAAYWVCWCCSECIAGQGHA